MVFLNVLDIVTVHFSTVIKSGLHHGLGRTKVGAWMPRMVGVVLAHSGVGQLTEGLLTLPNLMGDAGINDEATKTGKRQKQTQLCCKGPLRVFYWPNIL